MTVKRIFALLLILNCLSVTSWGQTSMNGDVTVIVEPQGALVTLKGEATVSGVAPARFRHLLIGDYQLIVRKQGYETYKSKITLDPSREMEINVALSPKTRFKAAARSLFIPGWGQIYGDQKTKGYAFTFMSVGAVAAYFIADQDFDNKWENFTNIEDEYNRLLSNGSVEELTRLHPQLAEARARAYDAENTRRITIGAAIGVWGLNMLDVLFFFPEQHASFSVKGLTIEPEADLENVSLKLSLNF